MGLDALSRAAAVPLPLRPVANDHAGQTPRADLSVAPPQPNPRLRLDPALGVVVMEFRSGPGVPARSIPSERELAAYRAAARVT